MLTEKSVCRPLLIHRMLPPKLASCLYRNTAQTHQSRQWLLTMSNSCGIDRQSQKIFKYISNVFGFVYKKLKDKVEWAMFFLQIPVEYSYPLYILYIPRLQPLLWKKEKDWNKKLSTLLILKRQMWCPRLWSYKNNRLLAKARENWMGKNMLGYDLWNLIEL